MSISHIKSISPRQADGEVKEIYHQLKTEMGDVVEPISLHAIIPDLLKGIWGILRETVIIEDAVSRKIKEAVGAAVSASNECPYCVDAHTIMIIGLKDKLVADAIVKKDLDLIESDEVRKVVNWAFNTRNFKSMAINNPPFSSKESAEIIGTAVFFHYLNRMVTIFLGPTILPLNINFFKGMMKAMAAKMFSGVLHAERKEGENKGNYANIKGLYWASGNPRVEYVFTYFFHVVSELADQHVPQEVQSFIKDQIMDWDGSDMENTKNLDTVVSVVSSKNQPLARMLYLTAFSPHRIQDYHFKEFHMFYNGKDEQILASLCWASLLTSIRIGDRLGVKFKYDQQEQSAKVAANQ